MFFSAQCQFYFKAGPRPHPSPPTHTIMMPANLKLHIWETSLMGQWLKIQVPNAGGLGLNSHQGTRSHTPQLKKTPHAATKTLCSQINKYINIHFFKSYMFRSVTSSRRQKTSFSQFSNTKILCPRCTQQICPQHPLTHLKPVLNHSQIYHCKKKDHMFGLG